MLDLIYALTIMFMVSGALSGLWALYFLVRWDYTLHRYGMVGAIVSGGAILILSFLLKAIYIWPVLG